MQYYNITLMEPGVFSHAPSHYDLIPLLQYSFESLGLPCTVRPNTIDPNAINILINYISVPDPALLAGHNCVIFQLEQLDGMCTPLMERILRHARTILDYSPENISYLQKMGFNNVRFLPLGFHERMQRIHPPSPPSLIKDIDVLFYGYPADRRKQFLEQLKPHCKVHALFGFYGSERDAYIARSKVILNIHQLPAQIMEQVRISYLLNNGCCVVSEESANNPYEGMIATAPLDRLLQTCLHYVRRDKEREELARRGAALFAQQPMTEYLRRVVAQGL